MLREFPETEAYPSSISVIFEIYIVIVTKRQTLFYTEVSDVIRVPRNQLFDFMTDHNNWRKIYPNVASVKRRETDFGETLLDITESDGENYTVVQRMRRPDKLVREIRRRTIQGWASYTLDTVPEGTFVALTFQMKFRGLLGVLTPFVKDFAGKHMRAAYFDPLKRAAEVEFQIKSPSHT